MENSNTTSSKEVDVGFKSLLANGRIAISFLEDSMLLSRLTQNHAHRLETMACQLAIILCCCLVPAYGQINDTWNGGNGNWNVAANWNNGVPNGNYNVFIDGGNPVSSAVTLNISPSVNNLTIDSDDSLAISNGDSLTVNGSSINNAGAISLNASSCCNPLLLIGSSNVTLSGGGTVTLSNNGGNYIQGTASTNVLTNQETIQGSGNIGGGKMGLNNAGTINANQSNSLTLQTSSGLTNSGTIEATNGATLTVQNDTVGTTNTGTMQATTGGTLVLQGNTINNASGTIQAAGSGSSVSLNGGVTITGGTLTTSSGGTIVGNTATLNGVTITGSYAVPNGGQTTLEGTINNSGAISLNASSCCNPLLLIGSSNVTLSGGGTVTLSNNGGNYIQGTASTNVLTNQETIQGSGNIGNGNMGLINKGTITVNQSNTLTIDPSTKGFRNLGTLQVNASDTLDVTGPANSFLNFKSTANTLTGGTYKVTGTLEIDNINIVNNAANITLTGASSRIIDQSSADGLRNFATNATSGSFTLASGRSLTTPGNFINNGSVKASTGTTFTVGGTGIYTQSGTKAKTTVDGTLAASGGIDINGGSIFGNGGTLSGNVSSSGTLNIGDAIKKAGKESITGGYTQASAGILDIDIGGLTAGTKYDQLNITGAASLNGTMNLDLISGFTPTIGETFDIMNFASLTGMFATVNGVSINGSEHFSVVYNSTNVTLDVVSGASGPSFLANLSPPPGRESPGATPEPSSLLLLGSGLVTLAMLARMRFKAAA